MMILSRADMLGTMSNTKL